MNDISLINLKLQLETLTNSHRQLRKENSTLRHKLAKTIQERATLSSKKEQLNKKLRALISQLKESYNEQ